MKNIKLKVLKFILIIALVLGTLTTSVFAWFSSKYNTISTKISGSIVFEYFHAGDGSKEHPFIITRPIHYYHMVEFFQRTTILDVGNGESVEFGKEYIYFQIGCPLAQLGNPSNTNDPVNEDDWYVFDYNNAGGAVEYVNEGTIVPGTNVLASKTLNMAYYSGERALMPTGSSQIPFLGLIDGHNMTIDNLHIVSHSIVNVQDANGVIHKNVERFTADMGVFGCIAQGIDINGDNKIEDDLENGLHEASSVKNLYITNATIDLEGTASTTEMVGDLPSLPDGSPTHSNSYHLVNEDGEVSENGTAVAYVGYIAGHVYSTEGVIEHVYVNNCRIVGGSKAISGYGYFGVIIDPTTSEVVSSLGSQIANIYTQGDGSGFGGSISMTDLVERIAGVRADAPNIRNITAETVIIDEVENTITRTATAYANADAYNPSRNTEKIQYYYTPEAGLYYLYYRSSTNGVGYNYLYGENNHIQTKTITTITYEKDSETGLYKVVDGYKVYGPNATYLGVNGTFNPVAAEEEDAIILAFDNSNHLYYIAKVPYEQNYEYPYNGNENGVGYVDTIYYLNATNNYMSVDTSVNASSTWAFDGSNRLYTTNGNTRYYLDYDKDAWYLTPSTTFYIFKDSEGHFLKLTNTTLGATELEGEASKFEIASPGGTTTISTIMNGARYYLRSNNGVLELSTTASNNQWSYDNTNGSYYITVGSTKYYLAYYNNSWVMRPEGYLYKISDNGNYLNATNTTTFNNVTVPANASFWKLDPNAQSTTISTIINGTVTYLGINNNGALALNTSYSSTLWIKDGDAYYTEVSGAKLYLGYENGSWRVGLTGYKIYSGNNYLNAQSTTAVNNITTGATNASTWVFDPDAATTEFYTFYSGTKVYLGRNGYNLAVSTTSTIWTKDSNNKYYITIDGTKFYLVFKNNAWALENEGYKISDGSTNYLTATSTTAFGNTTEANALAWIMDTSAATTTIATIYSGTKVYLGRNGYNLAVSTSSTTWTKESTNKYYITIDGVKFYVVYKNNAWTLENEGYKISDGSTNYLTATSTTAFGNTTEANALAWIMDTSAATTTIATIHNGTKTYLGINNGALALNTSYSSSTWTKEGNSYYVLVSGEKAYLIYDGGWKIAFDGYKISDGSTNYLTATSTTAFGNTTEANALVWFLDPSAASTTISTIYNGTKTYLGINNGALALNTTYSSTTWTKDANGYYILVSGEKAYLIYDSGWKVAFDGYRIKNTANNNFLNATSTTAFGNHNSFWQPSNRNQCLNLVLRSKCCIYNYRNYIQWY